MVIHTNFRDNIEAHATDMIYDGVAFIFLLVEVFMQSWNGHYNN